MKKPVVTVIIPSYNHAKYIKQTIDSVLLQSYGKQNIELMVVDDNSTDYSPSLLNELQKAYGFQLTLNHQNQGIVKNINKAIAKATGKYIAILGSDDVWKRNKLEKQVEFLETHTNIGAVSANCIRIDAKGNPLPKKQQNINPSSNYGFKEVFLREHRIVTLNTIMRKSVLDEIGLYDENLKIEDYYMWLKITHAGYQIHLMQEVLGYYRIHETNTIGKPVFIYKELRKIIDLYKTHELYNKALTKLNRVYFPQLASVKRFEAIKLLPKAISKTRFFLRGMKYMVLPRRIFLSKN